MSGSNAVRAADLGQIYWRHNVLDQCERVELGGGHAYKVMEPRFSELVCEQLQLMHGMKPRKKRFPGCQPVSLMREQLPFLLGGDYFISPKPDGTRYMLGLLQLHVQCDLPLGPTQEIVDTDDAYDGGSSRDPALDDVQHLLEKRPQLNVTQPLVCLMDRSCQVYLLEGVTAPAHVFPACLDGELVRDHAGQWRFLLFEMAYLHGLSTTQFCFAVRMQLFTILASFFRIAPATKSSDRVFARIDAKEQYPIDQLHIWADKFFRRDFEYPCDGEVCTPNRQPVRFATNWLAFKIKRVTDSTIDVELQPIDIDNPSTPALDWQHPNPQEAMVNLRVTGRVEERPHGVHEYVPGKPQQYRLVETERFCVEAVQPVSATLTPELLKRYPNGSWAGKIAECYLVPQVIGAAQYRVKDIRTDKEHPNNALTVHITKINMEEDLNTARVFATILEHQRRAREHITEQARHKAALAYQPLAASRPGNARGRSNLTMASSLAYFVHLMQHGNWTPHLVSNQNLAASLAVTEQLSWEPPVDELLARTPPDTLTNRAIVEDMNSFGQSRLSFYLGKVKTAGTARKQTAGGKQRVAATRKQLLEKKRARKRDTAAAAASVAALARRGQQDGDSGEEDGNDDGGDNDEDEMDNDEEEDLTLPMARVKRSATRQLRARKRLDNDSDSDYDDSGDDNNDDSSDSEGEDEPDDDRVESEADDENNSGSGSDDTSGDEDESPTQQSVRRKVDNGSDEESDEDEGDESGDDSDAKPRRKRGAVTKQLTRPSVATKKLARKAPASRKRKQLTPPTSSSEDDSDNSEVSSSEDESGIAAARKPQTQRKSPTAMPPAKRPKHEAEVVGNPTKQRKRSASGAALTGAPTSKRGQI